MTTDMFVIYQINDAEKNREYRCRSYAYQIEHGFMITTDNYEISYCAKASQGLFPAKIRKNMESLNPDVVFTCAPNDYHNDHRCLSRLVLNSAWAPVFFAETSCGVDFNPDFYVDITEFIETKIEMARQHQSQFTEDPKETIEIVNRFRALQCRRKEIRYAECFKLYKRFEWVKAYELLPHDDYELPEKIVPTTERN